MPVDLSDRRVVSWRLLAAVLAVEVALTAAFNLAVFRSEWLLETVFRPVFVVTDGLVGPTLVVNAVNVLLILMGLLFAFVYHRTGCLLVAVGVHAVGNAPAMLVETPVSGHFLTIVLAVVLVAVWPRLVEFGERTDRGNRPATGAD